MVKFVDYLNQKYQKDLENHLNQNSKIVIHVSIYKRAEDQAVGLQPRASVHLFSLPQTQKASRHTRMSPDWYWFLNANIGLLKLRDAFSHCSLQKSHGQLPRQTYETNHKLLTYS